MARSRLVAPAALALVALVCHEARAERLSFEPLVNEPEPDAITGGDTDAPGSFGFILGLRLPTGAESYVTGRVGSESEVASLAYGLGLRQPIDIGPLSPQVALELEQVAGVEGPAPPTAGIELGLPLGRAWTFDATGGYRVDDRALEDPETGSWFARANLTFRP